VGAGVCLIGEAAAGPPGRRGEEAQCAALVSVVKWCQVGDVPGALVQAEPDQEDDGARLRAPCLESVAGGGEEQRHQGGLEVGEAEGSQRGGRTQGRDLLG
jgi:hypothetical protein